MKPTVSELLRITKEILDYCISKEPTGLKGLTDQWGCDKLGQQCSVKAVYNIILELSSDSLQMIEEKRHVSSAALLRSLTEYYIELLFLAKEPGNYKLRELDAKREQQKILNTIENTKDPSLAKFKADSQFEPRKVELRNALKDHSHKNLWDLCDELKCNFMHEAVYRILSSVAHPSIINYNNRYFPANPNGEGLVYHPAPQLDKQAAIQRLVLLSNILINSTKSIYEVLPNYKISAVEVQLEKFVKELNPTLKDNQECLCCEKGIPKKRPRQCPICGHEFQGNGWDGIDAHWRAKHEDYMSYEKFWASLCSEHTS